MNTKESASVVHGSVQSSASPEIPKVFEDIHHCLGMQTVQDCQSCRLQPIFASSTGGQKVSVQMRKSSPARPTSVSGNCTFRSPTM